MVHFRGSPSGTVPKVLREMLGKWEPFWKDNTHHLNMLLLDAHMNLEYGVDHGMGANVKGKSGGDKHGTYLILAMMYLHPSEHLEIAFPDRRKTLQPLDAMHNPAAFDAAVKALTLTNEHPDEWEGNSDVEEEVLCEATEQGSSCAGEHLEIAFLDRRKTLQPMDATHNPADFENAVKCLTLTNEHPDEWEGNSDVEEEVLCEATEQGSSCDVTPSEIGPDETYPEIFCGHTISSGGASRDTGEGRGKDKYCSTPLEFMLLDHGGDGETLGEHILAFSGPVKLVGGNPRCTTRGGAIGQCEFATSAVDSGVDGTGETGACSSSSVTNTTTTDSSKHSLFASYLPITKTYGRKRLGESAPRAGGAPAEVAFGGVTSPTTTIPAPRVDAPATAARHTEITTMSHGNDDRERRRPRGSAEHGVRGFYEARIVNGSSTRSLSPPPVRSIRRDGQGKQMEKKTVIIRGKDVPAHTHRYP